MSIELVVTESMIDGAVLKYMRRVKKLAQKDISAVINVSVPQYSRYETGNCDVPIKVIRAVSKLTGNDILDFCKHVHRACERIRTMGVTISDVIPSAEEQLLSEKIFLPRQTLSTIVKETA